MNVAIIPARGGSKRIPRKNIRDFHGKPIIAYSIELAIRCELFEDVIVSTDDLEIAEVAQKYGARVPFMRSQENSDDYATLADVMDEVISCIRNMGITYHYACCILPAAPLITIENLTKGLKIIADTGADSVRPLVSFAYPIQRAVKLTEDGACSMFYPEYKETRSQDLESAYHDAGQFYWMQFGNGLRGHLKMGFEISEMQVQDIDTEVDWKLAELKYQLARNPWRGENLYHN